MTDDIRLERFHEATARLEALIEATPTPTDGSLGAVTSRAEMRMGRLRRFLDQLGNPEQGYPIVHVGGTSGKGSTSTMIAAILTSAGFTTGLHTSPYLQTPSEKLQVNGDLIAADMYVDLTDRLLDVHEAWLASGEPSLTYGEAWVALTLMFFREINAEIAVLEVGAGGRFDLTNIVSPVVSVVTSVGIDHTATLGSTIPQIAWHKAGIIKAGIPAVTGVVDRVALAVLADEARIVGTSLTVVDPVVSAQSVVADRQGTGWVDGTTGFPHHTSLRGGFQARNGAVALAAVQALRDQGFHIPDEAVERGLQSARIPGRMELVTEDVPVMLDGAHNAEKVAALAGDVATLLPVANHGRRIGVLGVLEAKQAHAMLESIVHEIDVLVATAPQVTAKESRNAAGMATIAQDAGFHGEVVIEPDPRQAIDRALAMAAEVPGSAVLVTGSLYLVGNVREHWYHTDDVIRSRSSWPVVR
ncbi:MAG TPA: Mur ligase family protein [Thermomicrobiales bacterium]|nr:Mur ligase family protein [Thermomicrobiales bacterium]